MSVNEELVKVLTDKKMTVSTAESCTGGLISKLITDVSGSSEVFRYGFVTYANEAKINILGVWDEALSQYGAVSEPVAVLMSCGARRVSKSDIAVSVTGIAGPGGGTAEKPVGLVYVSLSTPDGTICR
ncbi:MAG: nicotinamide-nucleotide amidohydrolase family protein, partial [Clostridia bacterium]|nr:nicotinamide-nucleotide amidohydrolase family protein [Clostridia bacterium]